MLFLVFLNVWGIVKLLENMQSVVAVNSDKAFL